MGLPSSNETQAFAEQIFSRVERKTSGLNLYQHQEHEAAMLAKKQRTYTLLEADDNDVDVGGVPENNYVSKAAFGREDSHTKRFRRRTEIEEDEDDEVVIVDKERNVRMRTSKESDNSELVEQKLTRKEEEEAVKRSNALEKDEIQALRKVSRQKYLKKREQKKLEELKYWKLLKMSSTCLRV